MIVGLTGKCSGRVLYFMLLAIPKKVPIPHPIDVILGTPTVDVLSCQAVKRGMKVDTSRWEHDPRLEAIRARAKSDQYLPNFDVIELFKEELGLGKVKTVRQRIIHGLQRCFRELYKPRAGSLSQNLVQGICGYRCSACVHYLDRKYIKSDYTITDPDHLCLSYSGALEVLIDLMSDVQDFPFFFRIIGVVPHRNWVRMGASVPLLWWEAMELMTQTSTGSITCMVERLLMSFWISRAEDNLFGRTFLNRECFKVIREAILERSELITYHIIGVRPVAVSNRKWWVTNDVVWEDAVGLVRGEHSLSGRFFEGIMKGSTLDDRLARWVSVMIQFFYGPMLFVTGATSLSLEQSAQVEPGSAPVLRTPIEEIKLGGDWFPLRHVYRDDLLSRIFLQEREKIYRATFRGVSLESYFLEEQTTNSSGIVEDVLRNLKEELSKMVGKTNVHMITKVRQARIVDALVSIKERFVNFTSFTEGLDEVGKAGQRLQVNRRPRVIQMVRTCQQLVGFLLRIALKKIYQDSKYASVGKNVGDVRDMVQALVISSIPGFKSSNDVKGMDMSTKKPQVDFNFELGHLVYGEDVNPGLSCFFHHAVSENNRVRVEIRRGDSILEQSVTVCQYILALGRKAFESRREFCDGYFQSWVETSAMGFPSGWYPTSDNHNEIGIATLEFIEKTLSELNLDQFGLKPSQIRLHGAVAGDDQVLGVEVIGGASIETIAKVGQVVIDRLVTIMSRFGYECDPSISKHSAEFLKQLGVCGAPELFPSRLLLWTAERGDTSNTHMIGQLQVQSAMLQEKVSRSPNSEGWVDYMIAGALTLGAITVFRNSAGSLARRAYVGGGKGETSAVGKRIDFPNESSHWCLTFQWDVFTRGGLGRTLLLIPRFLWYVNHVQGVPPPPFGSLLGVSIHSGSQYTIKSLSIFWQILDAVRISYDPKVIINEIIHKIDGPEGPTIRELFHRVLDHLGYNHLQYRAKDALVTILLNESHRMPLELEWCFKMSLVNRLNVCCGIMLSEMMPLVHRERAARKEPIFQEWQEIGNGLLDRNRHDRSYSATAALRETFGIEVPISLVYYNRAGARIDQALEQVTPIVQERLEQDVDVIGLLRKIVSWEKYRGLFLCSWYDLIPNDGYIDLGHRDLIQHGWGHAVPGDSEISWLINALDLPVITEDGYANLSYRFSDELRLPGSVDTYVRLAKRCLRESREAFQLFLDSVGLSSKDGERLERYIRRQGKIYDMIPFAHNPRQTFFFGVSPDPVHNVNLTLQDPRGQRSPNYAFRSMCFISTIAMRPGMIRPIIEPSVRQGERKQRLVTRSYTVIFSPSLIAYLARVPRVPL
uniref:RNA-dependent RNA polymerase n=1 Tax=Yanbian Reovi tick virus 2 TaxID=2972312 RepID=A0A9E7V279_9REOV|nr:MAG: RNA-dependent RNA polymerase [Yanbian Reovi tick virus 2]